MTNFEDEFSQAGETEASNDADSSVDQVTPTAQSQVITLPPGTELEGLEVDGRDLIVLLSDGSQMVVPDGAIFVPQIVVNGVSVPPLNIAQLLTGNDPVPAAGPTPSSGGNFADDEGEIQAAFDLGDLLPFTDFSFPEETEEEIFPTLGDDEPEVVIQTPDDPVGVSNAAFSVSEDGLPSRNGTEPEGTNELSNSESTSGTIVFDAPDGLSSVLINGVEITGANQTITTPLGILTIISFDPDAGAIEYSYTLADNTTDPSVADNFEVTVIDSDGDEASATLTINIVDDAPIAADDTDTVPAGSFEPVAGDVLVNDVSGADGYAATGAVSGFSNGGGSAEPGQSLQGEYGVLTLNPDGTYTYARDFNTPGGVEESFQYTIIDADGSTSTATLTISIEDSPAVITFVPAVGDGTEVSERGLPPRAEEPVGSGEGADSDPDNNSDPSESTSSTITFNSPDGVDTITVGGQPVVIGSDPQTIDLDGATLIITEVTFDPVTGEGAITYEFTLEDNTSGDDTSFDIEITVTDLDGDTAEDTLTIDVIDDVPTARDDTATQAEENAPVTVDVFGNDTPGADDVALDAIALVDGTLSGAGALVYNDDGTFTYTPAPGEEGVVTFDYSITDGDGDISTATVTINLLEDSTPEIGTEGENIVAEAGLGARGAEPAGSDAASDSETTTGVIAISTGNDTIATLTINGVDVTAGGTVTTDKGLLTVTLDNGAYSYSYELTDNTLVDPDSDTFTLVVTDSDGDTAATDLIINIVDDVPTAEDDSGALGAGEFGPATGNVLDNDTQGADAADVSAFSGVGGSGSAGDPVQGEYGVLTLNADGSYSYTRDPGTPGGVTDTFTYTITDGDGDSDQADLVITIADAPVTLTLPVSGDAGTVVEEDGLAGPPAGSDAVSDSELTSGTFTFTAPDGPAAVTIGGVAVTAVGQTFTGTFGTLTIDAIVDGSISYTYELTTNTDGDATSDSFDVAVTDQDGDTVSAALDIAIVDDVPSANPDVDSVTEDGPTIASGNVLTGVDVGIPDANTTDGVADVSGADGAEVTGVAAGDTGADVAGNVGANVAGTFGSITFLADGEYLYALDNANETVQGLDGTETITEIFTYTITDGDGDTATTTVTITINGADDPVVINGLDGQGAEEVLDEDDLADGSSPDAGALTQTGDFTITSQDGLSTLTVGGAAVFDASNPTTFPVTIDDPVYGILTITGVTPVFDADGDVISATIDYSYTLEDNSLLHTGGDDNAFTDSFDVVATDSDGSTDSASLDITIIDDVPTANDDTAGQVTENQPIVIDALGNDTFGADGVDTANPASVFVSTDGVQGTATYDPATGLFTYTPAAGAGSDGNSADFFEYTIIDADGDSSTARVDITLQPDSEPDGGETIAAVDDDGLVGGNAASTAGDLDANNGDDPADVSETTFTGTIPFSVGNDTPAAITFAPTLDGSTATLGQEAITYSVNGNVVTATVTGGDRDGTDLFTVEITDSATGAYVVTLLDNVVHTAGGDENNAFASLDFVITDSDGDTTLSNLDINFDDDAPTATDNSNSVGEGATVNGNILTDDDGAGTDVAGADGFGAGGAIVAIGSGAASQTTVDGSGNLVITSALGTLTVNAETGAYSYASAANSTNADAQDIFTYTIIDGDGDEVTANLVIDVTNVGAEVTDNDVLVNEAGMPIGSDSASDSETDTDGQITVVGATGTLIFNLLTPADGTFGTLTLDSATGEYSYTLDTPFTDTVDENGTNTVSGAESFNYEVRDTLGNLLGTGTIDVNIVDDIPTATDQAAISVAEDAVAAISGNVTTDGTPDTEGADGATVQAITIDGNTTLVPQDGSDATVITANGTYTIDQAGNWTFDPNPNLDQSTGPIDASFTYTLIDGDGDFDTAVQPITITDGTGPAAGPDITLALSDANLADGSTPANADDAGDTITFTEGSDDITSIVFGDVTGLDPALTWVRVSDTEITGSDGGRLVVTLDLAVVNNVATVTATLNDNFDDHPDTSAADLFDLGSVSVVATDTDGDTASADVAVSVLDDVPSISASDPAADALTVDETVLGTDASADFSGLFTSSFNADNPGTPVAYALGVNAGATGLVDTATGEAVVLSLSGGVVEGRTAGTGDLVFTVSVDAAGEVTLDQQRAVEHANTADDNDAATLAVANLITLTGTIVDSDGDTATATANIAGALTFLDDGPAISDAALDSAVDVDETDGLTQSDTSADPIITFTSDFGADGDGGTAFTLAIVNAASGLTTAVGDYPITLVQTNATTITGTFDPGTGAQDAFTVTINADGTVSLTQIVALEHTVDGDNAAGEHNDALTLDGLINATVTITDGDGDTDTATVAVGGALTFFDDGPSVTLSGTDFDLAVSDSTLGTDATQNFENAFAFDGGEDGLAGVSYALSVSANGADSGIVDLASGQSVFLFLEGGVVVGRTGADATAATTGPITFTVSVDASGNVTLDQQRIIDHASSNGDGTTATLLSDGVIGLTATGTDNDGDTASATLDIGSDLLFGDDVPAAAPDTDTVVEGGTVTDLSGGNVLANDASGADVQISVVGVAAGDVGGFVSGNLGGASIAGAFGTLTLNADGTYSYTSDANSVTAPGAQDVFTYTISDADGDLSTTTLTITITDVSLVGDNENAVVNEAALDTNQDGDDLAAGTVTGSNPTSTDETVTGQVTVTGTGVTYAINGATTGNNGIIALNATTGEFTYTLTTPVDGADADNGTNTVPAVESFTYTATDANGNTTTGTITIDVIDDVPVATNDGEIASVDDNASGVTVGTVAGLTGNDTFGADGEGAPAITIATGSLGGTVSIVAGNLVYTSATDITDPFADQVESFTYIITDGDGDTDAATFQIRLTDDGPAIAADSATFTVDEEGLDDGIAGGTGDVAGEAISQTGTLAGLDFGPDGPGDITLTAVADTGLETLAGNAVETVWDPNTNTLTGEDSVTGEDVFTLVITDVATGAYSFILLAPIAHPTADTEDDQTFEVQVVVTDAEGESANGTITVTIDDDTPVASPDTDMVTEGASATGNVLTNDAGGADSLASSTITQVASVNQGTSDLTAPFTLTGEFGSLTLLSDGSYTYAVAANSISAGGDDVFTYTIIDSDGDTSTTTLTISVSDVSLSGNAPSVTVFEEALDTIVDAGDVAAGTDVGSNPGAATETAIGTVVVAGATGFGIQGGTSSGGFATLVGTFGTISINETTGEFAYTLTSPVSTIPSANDGVTTEGGESFTYTATDASGNTTTGTITVDVVDDIPTSTVDTSGVSISHDETVGIDGDAQDVAGPLAVFAGVANAGDDPDVAGTVIGFAQDLSGVTSSGTLIGADMPGTTVFSLEVASAGVDSGLDTTEGTDILLYREGEVIVGRVGGQSGEAAFAIAIDGATGGVSLVQYLSIEHPIGGTGSPDEAVSIATGTISAVVTAIDADGDESTASADIGGQISFQDDAGMLGAFNSVTIDNAANEMGFGTFSYSTGADGHETFTITGPAIAGVVYQPLVSGLVDVTDDGINNPVNATTLTATNSDGSETLFTLSVGEDGSYKFTLVTPDAGSTETINLSALAASGPMAFNETTDGRIEFSSNTGGVNSSTQGFGVDNQFVGAGDQFQVEFHNPGTVGDDPTLTNAEFFSSAQLENNRDGGNVVYQITIFNDAEGTSEVVFTGQILGPVTDIIPVTLTEFNRFEVEGISGGGQGARFSTLSLTQTILPQNLDLDFVISAIDGDGDVTSSSTLNILVDASTTTTLTSSAVTPVVLDLDGDGAEFVGLDAGVTYDYGGDGVREATAFAGADDGILAFDANNDGRVTDASEFVFGGNGLTDLEAVAARFDDNGDGVLDASDAAYAQFGVWQDANLNGVNDDGEFTTLADAGITSIGLVSDGIESEEANGDVTIFGQSVFTFANGQTGAVADAGFVTERQNRTQEQVAVAAAGFAAITVTESSGTRLLLDSIESDPISTSHVATTEAAIAPVAAAEDGVDVSNFLLSTADVAGEQVAVSLLGSDGSDSQAAFAPASSPDEREPLLSLEADVQTFGPGVSAFGQGGAGVAQAMEALLLLETAPAQVRDGTGVELAEAVDAVLTDIAAVSQLDQIIDDLSETPDLVDDPAPKFAGFESDLLNQAFELSLNPVESLHLFDGQLEQAAAVSAQA